MEAPNSPELELELDLPGFRFHPTEEELLEFYLKGALHGEKLTFDVIGTINIYRHSPWELPGLAKIGEREWYFFVPRDMRHSHGKRPNRTTQNGFWKATGSDRLIRSVKDPKRIIGLRKTLVFYKGRSPRGSKTDWVMNEYRMPDDGALPKEDIVLCKIYRKATSLKTLEQRAAMEFEETRMLKVHVYSPDQASSLEEVEMNSPFGTGDEFFMEKKPNEEGSQFSLNQKLHQQPKRQKINMGKDSLPELQLPNHNLEWMHDPFLLKSPWLGTWSPFADLLNF